MSETVQNLVQAIKAGDALETEQAFANAMAEKLSAKLEDMRVAVAQGMFNQAEPVTEEETVDEEMQRIDELGNTPGGQNLLGKVKARAEKRAHDSRSATDTNYAFKQRAANVRSSARMN